MKKEIKEDTTQVSNVDAGKISTFKPVIKDDQDFYTQLLKLEDYKE